LTILFGIFADNILPILLAASVGFALQKVLRISPRPISQMIFYVFSPCLVFVLLVSTSIQGNEILKMGGFALVSMAVIGVASWMLTRILRLSAPLAAGFILVCTFMNAGNYGLSVNLFAFGEEGLIWASIFFIASAMATNSAGVYIANVGRSSPLEALKGLARVPAVYAIPLALIVRAMPWDLPLPIWRPIELLGSAAVPTMLVMLGMQIASAGIPQAKGLILWAAGVRLIAAPLVAWAISGIFELQQMSLRAGVLESGMPSAVLTTIIAMEYDAEPNFVTSAVLATTLLSPLTVTPLIALLSG
jgi:predicted permease